MAKETTSAYTTNLVPTTTTSAATSSSSTSSRGSSSSVGSTTNDTNSESNQHSESNNTSVSRQDTSAAKEIIAKGYQPDMDNMMRAQGMTNPDGSYKTPFQLLSVQDKQDLANQEARIKDAKRRQVAAAIYNSASVLGDIVGHGIGGNVQQRDPAEVKDLRAEEDKLETLRKAQEQAAQARLDKARDKALDYAIGRQNAATNVVLNAGDRTTTSTGTTDTTGSSTSHSTGTSTQQTSSSQQSNTHSSESRVSQGVTPVRSGVSTSTSGSSGKGGYKTNADGSVSFSIPNNKGGYTSYKFASKEAADAYVGKLRDVLLNDLSKRTANGMRVIGSDGRINVTPQLRNTPLWKWMIQTGVVPPYLDHDNDAKIDPKQLNWQAEGIMSNPIPSGGYWHVLSPELNKASNRTSNGYAVGTRNLDGSFSQTGRGGAQQQPKSQLKTIQGF